MNVINGMNYRCQSGNPAPYTAPIRNVRRLLWRWLRTVIGWGDHDKTASVWDSPELTGTDGATDSSNAWIFTSATGGFATSMIGYLLCVHPTDATAASTGGFSDPLRNGFYKIVNVLNGNTLVLAKTIGVHHLGLPLSETGLHFTIDDFYTTSKAPVDTNFFVLEGEYTDTTKFHFYNLEAYSGGGNYGRHFFQLSPYADWDNGTHAWNGSNRVTAQVPLLYDPHNSGSLVETVIYAGGDKTHFWMMAQIAIDNVHQDVVLWNVGEFDAFHAADTKPSLLVAYNNTANLNPWTGVFTPKGVNSDGTVPLSMSGRHMCKTRDSSVQSQDSSIVTRSAYSGRNTILPLIVTSEVAGYEGVRGQFKICHGQRSTYVGQQPRVVGATKQYLQIYDHVFAWNGSNVAQNFIGV